MADTSAVIRARVEKARRIQLERYKEYTFIQLTATAAML